MGCFLGCFGSTKDKKKRVKHSKKVQAYHQNAAKNLPVHVIPVSAQETSVPSCHESTKQPATLVSECGKKEEQLSFNSRKKVTFNETIKTYEPRSSDEVDDCLIEEEQVQEKEENKDIIKPGQSETASEDSSVISSVGSYPPNHRYQNCRDSDDEEDEALDYGDSDLDDEEDNEEGQDSNYVSEDSDEIEELDATVVDTGRTVQVCHESSKEEMKSNRLNQNARDRSAFVHNVLNPVENLTQWKAVKAKGKRSLKLQKENTTLELEEPRISFSNEPNLHFKPESDQHQMSTQEIQVDASLSNWLVSSGTTLPDKKNTVAFSISPSDESRLMGSSPMKSSPDDRPILGALTVDELRQFSATTSPRRSPSRSPDDMPIIGTVGTYWNHSSSGKDSRSVSSFKGIPNTSSKYREDKRVNWHSTPFKTRLEKALDRGADQAV